MQDQQTFLSLAVAAGLGLVIGLERELSAPKDSEAGAVGGARTFPLFALAGALAMLLAREIGVWVVGLVFGVLVAMVGLAYAYDLHQKHDRGLTSEVAIVVTFLL